MASSSQQSHPPLSSVTTTNSFELFPIRPFSVTAETLQVGSASTLKFEVYDFGETLNVTLENPSGGVIDSTTPNLDPNVPFGSQFGLTTYEINNPQSGNWVVRVEAGDLPDTVWAFWLSSSVVDGISLSSTATPDALISGDDLVIKATLLEGTSPKTGVNVLAIVYPDSIQATDSLTLLDDGAHYDNFANDGVYGGVYQTGNNGSLSISIQADGTTSSSEPFHKEAALSVLVTTAGFYNKGDLNRDFSLTPADVVLELNCVFLAEGECLLEIADGNCDGSLTPADVVLELNAVFLAAVFPC